MHQVSATSELTLRQHLGQGFRNQGLQGFKWMRGRNVLSCPCRLSLVKLPWGLLPSTLSAGVWSTKKLLDLKNPPSTKQKQFPSSIYTPLKFDLAPKKRYLEDYHLLLGPGNFQGPNSWNWVSPQPQLLQPRRRQRGRLGDFHPFHPDDLWCPRRAASRFSEQQVVPWS